MALLSSPTYSLQPSSEQVALSTNYITNFDFLNQYLPDTYEKEFERYGNRTISSFLRMVGAELPSNSDLIKWAEQGRLHIKYIIFLHMHSGIVDLYIGGTRFIQLESLLLRAGHRLVL